MSEMYVLNVNDSEIDVLHTDPAREECNTDDAIARQKVDARTADALIEEGAARWCAHCGPNKEVHL